MEWVEKGNKVKVILVSAICLGLLVIFVYSGYIWKNYGVDPIEQINSIIHSSDNEDYIPPIESENQNESPGNTVGGGSSGGGDGGSSRDGENSLTGCVISRVSYSLENLKKTESCNSYDGEICIDKTITCSVEIYNLDLVSEGFFDLELFFVESWKSINEAIERRQKSLIILPSTFELFNETLNIQSSGADGIANKIINCFYDTLNNPIKEC